MAPQISQIGQFPAIEKDLQALGQGGFAGMVGRQAKQPHHEAAGRLRRQSGIDGLPGCLVWQTTAPG